MVLLSSRILPILNRKHLIKSEIPVINFYISDFSDGSAGHYGFQGVRVVGCLPFNL